MPDEGYAAAVIRAERDFALAEAQGAWLKWATTSEVPPWWAAAAEYVFEIMKGRTEDALVVHESPAQIRLMWEVLTQAEASHIWSRVRLYGASEGKRGQRRRKAVEFAEYVERSVRPRLAFALEEDLIAASRSK
jgi:hypothetical protein